MKSPRNQPGGHRPQPASPIARGELWPIRLLHERLGFGARTTANMIRQGLPVVCYSKWKFVSTDALIDFLSGQADPSANGEANANE
jgi:hypothetical protein